MALTHLGKSDERFTRGALLSLALGLGMSLACQRKPEGRAPETTAMTSCGSRQWSPPAPLLTPLEAKRPVARNPKIVANASDLYVVGNNVPFLDQPVRIGETLTAWRVGGGSIGAPASDREFIGPKAVLDRDGRLH